MFGFFSKLPNLDEFPLKTYSAQINLDRLVVGVDNIRNDVHLSPNFCKATQNIVRYLIAKHADVEETLFLDKEPVSTRDIEAFRGICLDSLKGGVNKAKSAGEAQIDMLAQIAIVKMFSEEVQRQYTSLIKNLNHSVRKLEISRHQDLKKTIKIKEKLFEVQENKNSILSHVGGDLFQFIIEAQNEGLKEMREAVLGAKSNLPDDLFANPILFLNNAFDDYFRIDHYVLLGYRFEDPDNYPTTLFLIRSVLDKIILKYRIAPERLEQGARVPGPGDEKGTKDYKDSKDEYIDSWLKQVDNINVLFDYFQSEEQYKVLKKEKQTKEAASNCKRQAKKQKRLLNFIYKKFKKAGLITRISATYEMQPVYLEFCPPLVPHQVRQFLIDPRRRKSIISQLNRLKGFYGRSFSLLPLKKKIKHLQKIKTQQKKKYLLRFLNGFARYHRDFQSFQMLEKAMDCVNLVTDKKTLMLSRENYTLYEFLLPNERVPEKKPIINHVVIKADVRDSTNVTSQMKERGLNPASFFSLNLFDPITAILYEYTAEKVFIEGDAMILSISEHEEAPEGWYSVSRACGLAIQILLIVNKYNETSRKYELPFLEIGIGICHNDKPPTFLFDETNRIMISTAINSADRLSSNNKSLEKIINKTTNPFNLYVFQSTAKGDTRVETKGNILRYNVNGIELNAGGFEKLSKEIDLKTIDCQIPELQEEAVRVHTGKFPTHSGKYKRLVIREAYIPEITPHDYKEIRSTSDKYYEVCTHSEIYDYVRNLT
ncbi:MAG: hypothetical protein JSW04_13735 [Desulfobacterales bacterium]|nr:MAG: hypothetical protein JSW04_13735 [Desulfobacterales bacterium]